MFGFFVAIVSTSLPPLWWTIQVASATSLNDSRPSADLPNHRRLPESLSVYTYWVSFGLLSNMFDFAVPARL
jgi:hypothetical protein